MVLWYGMVAVINMLCGLGFIEVLMVVNAATPIIPPVSLTSPGTFRQMNSYNT